MTGSGAEQDRLGGWFGGNKADHVKDAAQQHLPKTSGAEQDRLGGWLGGDKAREAKEAVQRHLPQTSGAEQDRYGRYLGEGQAAQLKDAIQEHLPKTSAAEQDRYGNWFGSGQADQAKEAIQRHLPNTSGAEQDRYGGWFGSGQADQAQDAVSRHIPKTSGAEQDRYGGWFGGDKLPSRADVEKNLPSGSGAEQDRFGGWFGGHKGPSAQQIRDRLPNASGAEQDRFGSHFNLHRGHYLGTTTVGLLQNTVLPSFGLHAGLGAIAYGLGRYTDRAEAKDYLWPSGQVANAWWSAIGVPVVYGGMSVSAAWAALNYDQKLLLTGVSAWGLRLFYRIVTRSVKRGEDDPRYINVKKEDPGFWNKAAYTLFLPEAVVQTLISLPFVLPFRAPVTSSQSSLSLGPSAISHSLAVFLFAVGYSAEILADWQLESHVQTTGSSTLNRSGVWSVVRHPNYLGDALCHFSFSVLAASAGLLHPIAALGPLVNYAFLRNIGGDKQNEEYQEARYAKENPAKYQQLQEYKRTKNSFWPRLEESSNKWLWAVVGAGAAGVVLEQSFLQQGSGDLQKCKSKLNLPGGWDGTLMPYDLLLAFAKVLDRVRSEPDPSEPPKAIDGGVLIVLAADKDPREPRALQMSGWLERTAWKQIRDRVQLLLMTLDDKLRAKRCAEIVDTKLVLHRVRHEKTHDRDVVHAKTYCVDDGLLYVGSDNLYPSHIEEHRIWVEDQGAVE